MVSPRTDIGSQIKGFAGNGSDVVATGAPFLMLAGGGDDNVERQGESIDREDSAGGLAMSAKIISAGIVALDTAETLSLAHEYEDSADNVTFGTAVVIKATTVVATGLTAGAVFVDEHILDLDPVERFFRINVTPDFSRGATDSGIFMTVVVLGGYTTVPVSV